jgi:Glyoxalase/Bleomycin resistance protein/Dioxygenase superfamily
VPRVVGIDHLVLSVGGFARSKAFYQKLLTFLGFKLKHEYEGMAGWSNGMIWAPPEKQSVKKRKSAIRSKSAIRRKRKKRSRS